jgi:hypothetical protein
VNISALTLKMALDSLSKNRTPAPSTNFLTSPAIPNLPAHASTMTIGFSAFANRAVIASTTWSVTSFLGAAVVASDLTEEMAFISCAPVGAGRAAAVDSGGGAECG